MGANISGRFFKAIDNDAGVLVNQGAVLLDRDLNALNDTLDRRIRAAASDILGRSTVAANTPEAFKITPRPGGGLQIGKGRLYVDGLLAENHGAALTDPANKLFDPLMAEVHFADPVPYDKQPYLPSAPPLPEIGRYLVYLDVWNREVTHLQRPELVEVAVGVETSARRQIVWQVRVFEPDAGNATCATPDDEMADWAAHIAPSTGRLTTGTFEVPPEQDPCELPPTGGYRGLENQTYRVEIHDPSQPGVDATFKWSRENATVASRVFRMVSASELELESLGRDDVLRFNTGDWVEIIDDAREFSQKSGEMRQITVNEASRRITFTPDLPDDMIPGAFPDTAFPDSRNARVLRWDQKHKVLQTGTGGTTAVFQDLDAGTSGVITVPADGTTRLLLEHGVTVSFPSAGTKRFRVGDYWMFTARTADASVELLENEPPCGSHHRYARLGFWNVGAGPDAVTDCRTHWPPSIPGGGDNCACTVCVTAKDHATDPLTIQKAIDRVRDAGGGTVCLEVGAYALKVPVKIEGAASVKLVGKGNASQLVALSVGGAIQINKSHDIVLDSFSVLCPESITALQDAVLVVASQGIRVEHIKIDVESKNPQSAAIGLADGLTDLTLRANTLMAPIGVRSGGASSGGGATLEDMRIEANDFHCGMAAIRFAPVTLHRFVNRIHGNRVNGCEEAGFLLTGMTAPGFGLEVQANVFSVLGHGIVVSLSRLRVLDNDILQAEGAPSGQTGVFLVPGTSPNPSITDCQILGNRIQGFDRAIFVTAPLQTTMIKQNQINKAKLGLVLDFDGVFDQLSIENNQFNMISGSAILAKGKAAGYSAIGNQIRTSGLEPAVRLEFNGGEGVFSHNECYRVDGGDLPDVRLQSTTLIVGNNRVVGGGLSLDIQAATGHYTVLGNLCRGKIVVQPSVGLPAPWAQLNLQGV